MTSDFDRLNRTRAEADVDPLAVCTLPPDGREQRLAWIRSEILPHAVDGERIEDGLAWEFDDAPGLAARLDRLVALERECCSGIVFEHQPSQTAGRRRLEVRGIDPQAPIFANLQLEPAAPGRAGPRLAKAAGLGTLVSLFVCCVLPIAAAGVLGAAAAAPFASLDDPWIIAAAALLTGAVAFARQNRRRAAPAAKEAAGAPCGPGG
jgi:hypothetical protein